MGLKSRVQSKQSPVDENLVERIIELDLREVNPGKAIRKGLVIANAIMALPIEERPDRFLSKTEEEYVIKAYKAYSLYDKYRRKLAKTIAKEKCIELPNNSSRKHELDFISQFREDAEIGDIAKDILDGDKKRQIIQDALVSTNMRRIMKRATVYTKYLKNRGIDRYFGESDSDKNVDSLFTSMVSYGTVGMIEALDKYKIGKGARLGTYAQIRIDKSIMQAIRDGAGSTRIPDHIVSELSAIRKAEKKLRDSGQEITDEKLGQMLGIDVANARKGKKLQNASSLDKTVGVGDETSVVSLTEQTTYQKPEEEADRIFNRELVGGYLSILPPREAWILKYRWGIGTHPHNSKETSEAYSRANKKFTREKVKQTEAKALRLIQMAIAKETELGVKIPRREPDTCDMHFYDKTGEVPEIYDEQQKKWIPNPNFQKYMETERT